MFVFRLALALGMTVKDLKDRLTIKELYDWMAYYEEEPWGSHLEGLRSAATTAAVYNSSLLIAAPKQLKSNSYSVNDCFIGRDMSGRAKSRGARQNWRTIKKNISTVLGKPKKPKAVASDSR